jgi:hypothetical protein
MSKEILGEAFHLIEKVAPALASALSSPAAGLGVSFLLSLIGKAFNVDPNDKNISDKILSDPECNCKLEKLNESFLSSLSSIDVNFKANFSHDGEEK